MKLAIAYDGSGCSEAAIDDLVRAGLPSTGEATVISVAEVWLPPPNSVAGDQSGDGGQEIEDLAHHLQVRGEKAVAEAAMLAKFAETRVRTALPDWEVSSIATYGSPAWEIIAEAERMSADLIIVGSQGHSILSRFVLGSISQKVLTEARCSVRVARGSVDIDPGPEGILIAFDGSNGAEAAVDAVAKRSWSDGSNVRLIAVTEPVVPSAIGRFVTPIATMVDEINVSEQVWLEKRAEKGLAKLRDAGLSADLVIRPGNPKHVIAEEAERWSADCIFVGANAWGSWLERAVIGSTSSAVAARARCSVEVVRGGPQNSSIDDRRTVDRYTK